MAVSLASSAATLSASAVAFSSVLFVMSRVFSSIASASRVSVSRMICSSMPMTPPAPEDCLYSLKPGGGGGRRLLLRGHLEELLLEDGREHIIRLLEERLRL